MRMVPMSLVRKKRATPTRASSRTPGTPEVPVNAFPCRCTRMQTQVCASWKHPLPQAGMLPAARISLRFIQPRPQVPSRVDAIERAGE